MSSTDGDSGLAHLLFRGGPVYTMDLARPQASALAVRGDRIVAMGVQSDLDALRGPATRIVDLAGRAVLPGFVDAHIHFGSFAMGRRQVNLDAARTLEDGLTLLAGAARDPHATGWLLGRGWDRNRWGRLPTAADLDRVAGDVPAALSSHDGHSLWLNSLALAEARIDQGTPDPPGGRIERDEQGHPVGVLFENAQALARRAMPAPSVEQMADAIRAALPVAAAAGITGIHNFEDATSLRAFAALRRSGELMLRVFHGVPRGNLRAAAQTGMETGFGDAWLRIGAVKLFADGALGSRTAFLLDPYEGRADGYRGIATLDAHELREDLVCAARAGLGVAVHAIGDAAVRAVLDNVAWVRTHEPAGAEALFRIEHAQLVHPDDVPRFAALNVVASMQPIHAVSDWRAADEHWGRRARHGYAWRSLLDAGAPLAFGTDAPVERIEPLHGLHAAVTRQDPDGQPEGGWYPEQRLNLAQAIRAYTLGSVQAEQAAGERGSLAVGKLADLVVLSLDPFAHGPDALLEAQVDMTVVGGRVVHEP